jgi:DNA-binding PadR family transcriptional regulator
MTESPESGPLTESVFYVLLALHTPMHGYGVMQYAYRITDGRITIGAGTLYGALTALVDKGWIAAVAGEPGERKKRYIITDLGRLVFDDELERLEELLRNGRGVTEGAAR